MIATLVIWAAGLAQEGEVVEAAGPGVKPPTVRSREEPTYSVEGREARIQGTVLLHLVVDRAGLPTEIKLVSPLGFGMDQMAISAVEKWKFRPATKNGEPVRFGAYVEVNFRFLNSWFNEEAERQRRSFNLAVHRLEQEPSQARDPAQAAKTRAEVVGTVERLAKERFAPAQHLLGTWKLKGGEVPKDPDGAAQLFEQAAAKNYGPAIYRVAWQQIEKGELEAGLAEMRRAAVLGSLEAQFHLGHRYEMGEGVPMEHDRAQRYFRLCAAKGHPSCAYRLAYLLFQESPQTERQRLQALAWMQLAAEGRVQGAREKAEREAGQLTPQQLERVASLKQRLVPR